MVKNNKSWIQKSEARSQDDKCKIWVSTLNPKSLILIPIVLLLLTAFCVLPLVIAQQPQTQAVQELFPVNAKYVQGFGPGYWPTAGSNLTLNLAPGTAVCNNTVRSYAGGALTLAPNATNYVYLNTANNCAPASNTTGFGATTIPIATVVTNSNVISSVTDVRTLFVSSGATGAGSVTSVAMGGDGIIFNPTVTGSPITSTGTLTLQLMTQTANAFLAGPGSGQPATPTFRALLAGDLPPTIFSNTTGNAATATALFSSPSQCGGNSWATGISSSGNANCLQPGFGNLTGSLALGQTPLTAAGDLIFADATPELSRLPIGGTNQFLGISGGLPAWMQPTFSNVGGTVTVLQGGTGQTTATGAFNVLSPLTTEGDILYFHSSANARLARGSNGQCLTSNGTDPVWGSCNTGSGTVTSVGLTMPAIFSVSGSPVTGSGTLTASLANQNANLFMAGPASGSPAAPTFRSLVGTDLPAPTASTLGGVESKTCTAGQFLNQISTTGAPACGTSSGGGSTGLGNGTTVLDASLQAGADLGSKLNAAIAACPNDGCIIDARGLGGPQTLGVTVPFSSADQPITILLAGEMTLTRANGMQFQVGSNGRLIGQGKASTMITGNDSAASVAGIYVGGAPSAVDIENLDISNSGIGPCVDFLISSGGALSSTFHDNTLNCATGLMLTGYWNRIWNNNFNLNPSSVFWAGTVLDTTGSGEPNSNHIYDNVYGGGGGGTGDFVRNGYSNKYDGSQDYEGTNLAVFDSAQAQQFHIGGDVENVYCNNRSGWIASTAFGRGAVIYDSNGNCEIDVTPTASGYSTMSGASTPTWPVIQGNTITDGGVTWEMYSGNSGESPFIIIDAGSRTNVIDGPVGQNPYVGDLDYIVNRNTSNIINTSSNGAWGTSGTAPYGIGVGASGLSFINQGSTQPGLGQTLATFNLNPYNPAAGPYTIQNGASLDIPVAGNVCSTYGYCGHLNLRLGTLYPTSGLVAEGPTSFNKLPTPAAPTVTVVGTPGTATLTYYLVAHVNGGVTLASPGATINNAPNTLNSSNYVLIEGPSTIGSSSDPWSNATWDILKGTTSTSLYTNINLTPNGAGDVGGATSVYTPPTRNTTADEIHTGYVDFNGNVGIGTNNPAYPLHIVGSNSVAMDIDGSNQYTSFTVNNTGGKQSSVNLAQSGSQVWALGTDFAGAGNPDFFLYQSGGMRNPLYIDTSGNVRLGGTSGYSGTQAMTILQGGNVGIGISTPGQKLDVAGGSIRSDTGFCISSNCVSSLWSNPMTTAGDLIYGGTGGSATRLAGNISTTPYYLKSVGTGSAAQAPTLAPVQFSDLAGSLAGTQLPSGWNPVTIANGGTGQTTAAAAFNAFSPLTTEGDLNYYHASSNVRLALGGANTFLTSNGTDPSWGSLTGAGFASQTANTVLAAPNGSSGNPAFRTLVASDLPGTVVYNNQANTFSTGKQTFAASSSGAASFNTPAGATPTTPTAGDHWYDGDRIYVKDGETNSGVVSSVPRRFAITSAVTSTSTSAQTVGTFAVAASKTYCLMCTLFVQSNSSSNKPTMLVTCPASPTASQFGFIYAPSATTTAQADAACGTIMASPTATTTTGSTFMNTMSGMLQNGANAGSLTIQVESSGSFNTIIEPGSYCILY